MMPEWIAKYWLEWLFGVVIAFLSGYCRHLSTVIKKEKKEQRALRDGMRSLLRGKIIEDCEKSIAKGYCSAMDKATIDDMYEAYHSLGGNGTVSALHNQLMELPTILVHEEK